MSEALLTATNLGVKRGDRWLIKDVNMKRVVISKRVKDTAVIIQNSFDILTISDVKTLNYQFLVQLEF